MHQTGLVRVKPSFDTFFRINPTIVSSKTIWLERKTIVQDSAPLRLGEWLGFDKKRFLSLERFLEISSQNSEQIKFVL
jgi:hypothetical protein